MTKSELVGYVRKVESGNALKLSILKSAMEEATTVEGKDGTEYIQLIMNLSKIKMILNDQHEVTSICQLSEEPPTPTPIRDDESFTVTSVCKDDILNMVSDIYESDECWAREKVIEGLDRTALENLASQLADAYIGSTFWDDLSIVFEELFATEIREALGELEDE